MRPDLLGGTTRRGTMPVGEALHGITEVPEQMPSVSDLNSGGRTLPDTVGIGASPITGDDLHARMPAQPRGDGCGLPIGQEIDEGVRLEIHHHRAVAVPRLQAPVVDAQNPRGRSGCLTERMGQRQTDQRVPAGRDCEPARKARTSLTSKRQCQMSL